MLYRPTIHARVESGEAAETSPLEPQQNVSEILENRDVVYYKRYVDNLLIIFYQRKTNENTIHNIIKNIDEHLEFRTTIKKKQVHKLP